MLRCQGFAAGSWRLSMVLHSGLGHAQCLIMTGRAHGQCRTGSDPQRCYKAQVHKLSHFLADQAKRELDDRDLTSRSDLRREQKQAEQGYADLARALCDCTGKQLNRLNLHDALLEVVEQARRIDSPSAKDRAVRLVRRELRSADVQAIRRRLDAVLHPVSKVSQLQVEAWIGRLLSTGDLAIEDFVSRCAVADRQQLRTLVRNLAKATDTTRANATSALSKRITEWLNRPLPEAND